jgi:hypothetical protein
MADYAILCMSTCALCSNANWSFVPQRPDQRKATLIRDIPRMAHVGWPDVSEVQGRFIFRSTGDLGYLGLQDQLWPGGAGGLFFKEGFASEQRLNAMFLLIAMFLHRIP